MTAMLVNRDQKPLWALWGDDEEGSATSSSSLRFPTNDSNKVGAQRRSSRAKLAGADRGLLGLISGFLRMISKGDVRPSPSLLLFLNKS
jgi:hypothetical protein